MANRRNRESHDRRTVEGHADRWSSGPDRYRRSRQQELLQFWKLAVSEPVGFRAIAGRYGFRPDRAARTREQFAAANPRIQQSERFDWEELLYRRRQDARVQGRHAERAQPD